MSAIVRCLNKRGVINGFINAQWPLTAELFAKPNLSAPTGQVQNVQRDMLMLMPMLDSL